MLEKGLSDFDFSLERRQAVLQTIRKEENPVVKRKASAVLVLAVVLSLLIGGAALAATLGIFGHAAESGQKRAERQIDCKSWKPLLKSTMTRRRRERPRASSQQKRRKTAYDALIAALYNSRFEFDTQSGLLRRIQALLRLHADPRWTRRFYLWRGHADRIYAMGRHAGGLLCDECLGDC